MREIKQKSAIPVYIAAGVFAIYALIFPLYALWHFLIAACMTAAAWLVADALIKPTIEYVPEPAPEPVSYGAEADAILAEDAKARSELTRLRASIQNSAVRQKIAKLSDLGGKIAAQAKEQGADLARIKKFQNYYIPTTLKLLNAYDRMASLDVEGENISGTMTKISDMLDTEIAAYTKQLDGLFAGEAMDIDTEIEVMGQMLKREGLSDEDELEDYIRRAQASYNTKRNKP
jgi:5-bromo-4-chloroindolyl phosphate hydrolysis protein.